MSDDKDKALKELEKEAYGILATAKGVGPISKKFRLAMHKLRKKGLKDKDDNTKEKVLKGLKGGGALKPVPPDNKGLGKLPTEVRNNMGFYKEGGKVKKSRKAKRMSCPVDGMAKRGKTKARRKGR
jgi:hypothetical protein|tara:strand:+ start:1631 stop:2008 length:378 start_codon:yes stop_codon:yes gene_type:complete